MTDTLEIFGTEYTGVTGIVAKNDNGDDLRYVNENQYLPLTGGTLTGALEIQNGGITIPNSSYGYFAKDTNGTPQCLTYLTVANKIRIGNVNNTNVSGVQITADGGCEVTGGRIILDNNRALAAKDTDGNAQALLYINTANNVLLNAGNTGKTYLGGTSIHFNSPLDNSIIFPISTGVKSKDSNGDDKTLIYLAANNNVRINSDSSGVTQIVSNTEITGTVTSTGTVNSTGGALVANNCTTWNGGVAGGFFSTNGRCGLVSGSSSDYPNVTFSKNKNTNAATVLRANNTGTTTYTLTLPNSTGTLAISSSDIRLKENIKDVEVSGLELINKIKLHQFDWKEEGHEGSPHWKVGVIADELEELDANLAVGGGYEEDGSLNIKSIEIPYLLGYVIKAVQELSQEIIRLKNGGE